MASAAFLFCYESPGNPLIIIRTSDREYASSNQIKWGKGEGERKWERRQSCLLSWHRVTEQETMACAFAKPNNTPLCAAVGIPAAAEWHQPHKSVLLYIAVELYPTPLRKDSITLWGKDGPTASLEYILLFLLDWYRYRITNSVLRPGTHDVILHSLPVRETHRFFHLCIKSSAFWLVPAPAMLSGSPSPFHFIVGKWYHSGWLPCAVAGNLLHPVVITQGHLIVVVWPLLGASQLVSFFFPPHVTLNLL